MGNLIFHRKLKNDYRCIELYGFHVAGADDTGNITSRKNIKFFIDHFSDYADFFTSDCGLGAQSSDEMLEQEAVRANLNFAQILIGLITTKINGHMVIKTYLPYSKQITISLFYLCHLHFKQLFFIKQMSGSPGSSEIYLVALNKFRDLSPEHLHILLSVNLATPEETFVDTTLFDNYDQQFILQLNRITTGLVRNQIDYIIRSFYYYDNPAKLQEHKKQYINDARFKFAEQWVQKRNFTSFDPRHNI